MVVNCGSSLSDGESVECFMCIMCHVLASSVLDCERKNRSQIFFAKMMNPTSSGAIQATGIGLTHPLLSLNYSEKYLYIIYLNSSAFCTYIPHQVHGHVGSKQKPQHHKHQQLNSGTVIQTCLFTRREAVTAVRLLRRLTLVSHRGSPLLRRPRYRAQQEKMSTRGQQSQMESKKESLILDVVSSEAQRDRTEERF